MIQALFHPPPSSPELNQSYSNLSNPELSGYQPGSFKLVSREGNGPEVTRYLVPVDWDGGSPIQSGVLYRFANREAFFEANAFRPKYVAHMREVFQAWDASRAATPEKVKSGSNLASAYETASASVHKSGPLNIASCSTWTASFTSGNGSYVTHDLVITQLYIEVESYYEQYSGGAERSHNLSYDVTCPEPFLGTEATAGHHYVTEGSDHASDSGGCGD